MCALRDPQRSRIFLAQDDATGHILWTLVSSRPLRPTSKSYKVENDKIFEKKYKFRAVRNKREKLFPV